MCTSIYGVARKLEAARYRCRFSPPRAGAPIAPHRTASHTQQIRRGGESTRESGGQSALCARLPLEHATYRLWGPYDAPQQQHNMQLLQSCMYHSTAQRPTSNGISPSAKLSPKPTDAAPRQQQMAGMVLAWWPFNHVSEEPHRASGLLRRTFGDMMHDDCDAVKVCAVSPLGPRPTLHFRVMGANGEQRWRSRCPWKKRRCHRKKRHHKLPPMINATKAMGRYLRSSA